jgi:hypothetical protein
MHVSPSLNLFTLGRRFSDDNLPVNRPQPRMFARNATNAPLAFPVDEDVPSRYQGIVLFALRFTLSALPTLI